MKLPPSPVTPYFQGGPEGLFTVDGIGVVDDVLCGTMTTGAWMTGPDGRPSPGTLGVLVDDVLGYAIVTSRPREYWSVSTEISIDFVEPVPGDGSQLRAALDVVQSNSSGGLASGTVTDQSGRVLARCRQRGRFVPGPPAGVVDAGPEGMPVGPTSFGPVLSTATDAVSLLGLAGPGAESAEPVLEVTDRLTNPLGNLHGGVSLCASELVANEALLRSGPPLVAASIHLAYVRPSPAGSVVRWAATVLHRGRTLGVVQVVGRNGAGKTTSIATITAHAPE